MIENCYVKVFFEWQIFLLNLSSQVLQEQLVSW
jgi:hypothetical protein